MSDTENNATYNEYKKEFRKVSKGELIDLLINTKRNYNRLRRKHYKKQQANGENEEQGKALHLRGVRLSLLDLDKINKQSKSYADQYKTQVSSEGLQNIADDFQNGARWVLEFLRNEA